MKQDEIGDYNENEIPFELALPVRVDEENQALMDSEGRIIAIYRFTKDTLDRAHARRKLEMVVRLSQGSIMYDRGKIFVRKTVSFQNGDLVVRYSPAEEAVPVGSGANE